MSSIIACSSPPAVSSMPLTRRGVLSSESMPIDWASLRAGSIVSTTDLAAALRGAQAERRGGGRLADAAGAAAHDDARPGVVESGSMSSTWVSVAFRLRADAIAVSSDPLLPQFRGQPVQARQVHRPRQQGQFVQRQARVGQHRALAVLQLEPLRVLRRLVEQRVTSRSAPPPLRAPPRPAADSALAIGRPAARRPAPAPVPPRRRTAGRTMFTMSRPTGRLAAAAPRRRPRSPGPASPPAASPGAPRSPAT